MDSTLYSWGMNPCSTPLVMMRMFSSFQDYCWMNCCHCCCYLHTPRLSKHLQSPWSLTYPSHLNLLIISGCLRLIQCCRWCYCCLRLLQLSLNRPIHHLRFHHPMTHQCWISVKIITMLYGLLRLCLLVLVLCLSLCLLLELRMFIFHHQY